MIKIILKEKSQRGDSLYRLEFFCDKESDAASLPNQKNSAGFEKVEVHSKKGWLCVIATKE